MIKTIRIPKIRIPVLIGRRREVLNIIEKETSTKISVKEEVSVEGESIGVMSAENIINAIGRGFSPKNALLLLNEETTFSMITLTKNRKELKRVKARLIGTKGKCRRNIENATNTKISVYGKTVSVIGKYEDVFSAQTAIEKLISGSGHIAVYKFLGIYDGGRKKEDSRGDG
jgi:ribosomal RNA assembly protein